MKNISPFDNTPTIVHVTELPALINPSFGFGFRPGMLGAVAALRVNIRLLVTAGSNKQIKIATYDSAYKIEGEGLILEEHVYNCCQHAIHAMKIFLQYDKIGRSIPKEFFQCPEREYFEKDLVDLAKALNALEGKRDFPPI